MQIDTDKNGNISIMEINENDSRMIALALINLSHIPGISKSIQNRSLLYVHLINVELSKSNSLANDFQCKLDAFNKRQLKILFKNDES